MMARERERERERVKKDCNGKLAEIKNSGLTLLPVLPLSLTAPSPYKFNLPSHSLFNKASIRLQKMTSPSAHNIHVLFTIHLKQLHSSDSLGTLETKFIFLDAASLNPSNSYLSDFSSTLERAYNQPSPESPQHKNSNLLSKALEGFLNENW